MTSKRELTVDPLELPRSCDRHEAVVLKHVVSPRTPLKSAVVAPDGAVQGRTTLLSSLSRLRCVGFGPPR